MQPRLVSLCFLCISVGWLAPAATAQRTGPSPWPSRDRNVLAEFRIPRDGAPIRVPVHIGGMTLPFLLDTGAGCTIYDRSLRPFLGPTLGRAALVTHTGVVPAELCAAPTACVGPLPMSRLFPVVVTDVERTSRLCGIEYYGVVGMDFLRDCTLHLDFEESRLAFLWAPPRFAGVEIPMRPDFYLYSVPASLPGLNDPLEFFLDTGCTGAATVRPEFLDHLLWCGWARDGGAVFGVDASGPHRFRRVHLAGLAVGGFDFPEVPVVHSQFNVLGLSYLSRFTVTLDFPRSRLFLKPRRPLNEPAWHGPAPAWAAAGTGAIP